MDPKLAQALQTAADPAAGDAARRAALGLLAKERAAEAFPAAVAALDVPALRRDALWLLQKPATDAARQAVLERLERADAPGYDEVGALSDLGWTTPWPLEAARRGAANLRRVVDRGLRMEALGPLALSKLAVFFVRAASAT